jgi:hypothetical protein
MCVLNVTILLYFHAVTNATSIVMVIPFGGFERDVLTEVFTAYQQKYTADKNTYLLDLGYNVISIFQFHSNILCSAPAEEGLTHFQSGGTWESGDGIHPVVWRDGQLGAMLSLGIGRLLNI